MRTYREHNGLTSCLSRNAREPTKLCRAHVSWLKDVRIHDLRHTFTSTAIASGQGLPMIGKLLGHTQVQTTARYAHLAADPIKNAADQVASNIAASLNQAA
jgi:integrase